MPDAGTFPGEGLGAFDRKRSAGILRNGTMGTKKGDPGLGGLGTRGER